MAAPSRRSTGHVPRLRIWVEATGTPARPARVRLVEPTHSRHASGFDGSVRHRGRRSMRGASPASSDGRPREAAEPDSSATRRVVSAVYVVRPFVVRATACQSLGLRPPRRPSNTGAPQGTELRACTGARVPENRATLRTRRSRPPRLEGSSRRATIRAFDLRSRSSVVPTPPERCVSTTCRREDSNPLHRRQRAASRYDATHGLETVRRGSRGRDERNARRIYRRRLARPSWTGASRTGVVDRRRRDRSRTHPIRTKRRRPVSCRYSTNTCGN